MSKHPNDIPPPKFRTMSHAELFGPEFGMRPHTAIKPIPADFMFNGGGLGDYICYMVSILWLAKNAPWVRGTLKVPTFFKPLAEHWMRKQHNWSVHDGEKNPHVHRIETPLIAVDIHDEHGNNLMPQLLNAVGAHLVDLGFAYYCNLTPAPVGVTYPRLSLNLALPQEVFRLKGKYVVFTPGGMTSSRTVKARHLNPLIAWVKDRGLTPVFLGRKDHGGLSAHFDDKIDFHHGIDLLNKTSLLEAAVIMEKAACVVGLDNGLLHLAACTEANVVFGYNIASPKFREPKRAWGRLANVTNTKEELPCAHCQDHIKMLFTHSFHSCLYGDQKCIDLLFQNDGEKFKKAIDGVLPPGI